VDGEWVTLTAEKKPIHHYLLFDIYYKADGEKVSTLPFATFQESVRDTESESRYNALKEWYDTWTKGMTIVAKSVNDVNRLLIAIKDFYFAPPGNTIFTSGCSMVLDTARIYHTDGLILTSNSAPLPDGLGVRFDHQFKWKPSQENTVDFLVSFEKDTEYPTQDKIQTSVDAVTQLPIQYKTMRLYVGGTKSKEEANPRETILYQRMEEKEMGKEQHKQYRPILFHPTEYPDSTANICNALIQTDKETTEEYVMTEDSKEPIQHRSIVEMRYDPTREPGWRWIPARIRHDKTERLQRAIAVATAEGKNIKYTGMMNDERAANSVWDSIHDPVTESMIRSGTEQPTEAEWKAMLPSMGEAGEKKEEAVSGTVKYYERKAPQESITLIRGLLDFHNKYIKNEILLKRALFGFGKTLLDFACGKGGDIYKWSVNHARRVIGVDLAVDNITNPVDGAYRRYMDILRDGFIRNPPKMAFVVGDSSKLLVDGSAAGDRTEDRDILRSIFGRAEPEGPIPPHIQQNFAGKLREGADAAACMFALHYFFENKTTLDGFIKNVESTIKIGGLFVGCCFDGQKVFELLRGLSKGQTRTGSENDVPIWSITKDYDADQLSDSEDSLGLAIDVNFISIGMTHREYLVPFGFRLLLPEELAQLNLQTSTNTFDKSYRMAMESDKGRSDKTGSDKGGRYAMPESVKEFSFLNRWFIFKRAGLSEAELEVPSVPNAPSIPAAMEPSGPVEKSEAVVNRRFGIDITRYNKTYALYSIVNSSAYSVLKPWEKRDVNTALQKWFQPVQSVKRIVDATAHIGVDTINMSNVFPNATIDAYEIVPETYQALVKNIVRFKKQQRILPHNEDITSWEPSYTLDFLYVDPPWGGKNYAKEDSIDLYLQKESNEHNETKNVNAMIDKWLATGKIRNIVMKAPKNFNKDYLVGKYKVEEATVGNRQKGVAYLLFLIRAPAISGLVEPEPEPEPEPRVEEVQELEAEAEEKTEDLFADFRNPLRVFRDKEVFLFGPQVAIRDSLKVKERPAVKLTIKADHAGRWLSFTAPFPIPDNDAKTDDGEPIVYPTVEHYMAAMKYRHASNRPDLALSLFGRDGSIHQRFLAQRLVKKTMLGSGTPQDDKFLEEEAKEVRERLTKAFTDKHRVVFNEEKWNRPIRANDPLSMRDRILRDALQYRWEKDDNFRKILEELRAQKRYLLYTLGPDSDASEWAGRMEIAGPEKGRVRGENRIGFFLMELAGYA
jgi:hypothetical protein